jgi:phospho-N-acetylmuramoyl-pentapeptide-transferase
MKMLYWLGSVLENSWGPFRLLTSHFFLGGLGFVVCGFLAWLMLPRLAMKYCPRDRGRAHAVESKTAQGKPTGTGIIFIPMFLAVQLFVLPLNTEVVGILFLTFVACIFGFLDDKSNDAWGEYVKGAIDLVIGIAAAILISGCEPTEIWLPLTKVKLILDPIFYIPLAVVWIWISINATNCSDGVDGLSGTLSGIAFLSLGSLLYFVLGNIEISSYLLVPHYGDGAAFGILALSMVGTLAGYLWHNAHPSSLMMGDAGSRAVGFLLGVLVLKCGNPFLSMIVAGVLLVNGGTGLIKVALLRFFRVSILKTIRFPLHDHVRKNMNWSTPQVLVRFSLVQMALTLTLMVLLLKLR